MNLLDRVIDNQLLDLNLTSQLSDISYRTNNGIRQKNRAFSEGIVDVGRIHFNDAKDKITKDMILDYQEEQQLIKPVYTDPITGDERIYYPSVYNLDPAALPVFIPIASAVTGAAATEADIENTTQRTLRPEIVKLERLENDLITNQELLKKNEHIKIIADTKIQSTDDTIKEKEDQLKLNEDKIKEIDAEIKKNEDNKINELAKIPIGTAKEKMYDYVDPYLINMYDKNIKNLLLRLPDINDIIRNLKNELRILRTRFTKLQNDYRKWMPVNVDTVKANVAQIITDIGTQQGVINAITGDIDLLKDNLNLNKKNMQEHKAEIKKISRDYEEGMMQANPNKLLLQQQPNESSEDYITRIKTIEEEKFDINIHGDKTILNNIRKLKAKLKLIIREPSKIENIIKSFTPDEIYKINKYFEVIKGKFLKIYGYNNKDLSDQDIHDEMINILNAIESPPVDIYELEDTGPAVAPAAPAAPSTLIPLNYSSGSASIFEYMVDDNSLFIKTSKKHLYIKIGKKDGTKLILFSKSLNDTGNFSSISFRGSGENTWDSLFYNYLKLLTAPNKEIYDQLFTTTKRDDIFDELGTKYGLTPIDKIKKTRVHTSGIYNVNTYGWGINKNEEIPKYIKFGNVIILLNKLYHKNILSLKYPSMHAKEFFPNHKVSDTFVEIIMKLSQNEPSPTTLINSLKNEEKEILDTLLYVAGMHKKVNTNKNDTVDKLKKELQLIEGEISAGNNNKELLIELKMVLDKLYLLGVISLNAHKKYYNQFK
jgi:hypothetical protein